MNVVINQLLGYIQFHGNTQGGSETVALYCPSRLRVKQ
jgi:hypothetical protein